MYKYEFVTSGYWLIIVSITCISSCPVLLPGQKPPGYTQKVYGKGPDDPVMQNPDRGMYHEIKTLTSPFIPLKPHVLNCLRHSMGVNLLLRVYVINNKVLDDDAVHKIQNDLHVIQNAGFSAILRFEYTDKEHLPPGGEYEPSLHVILQHIDTIFKRIAHGFEGVITSIQAGFIGSHGNWLQTTHFGTWGRLTSTQFADRGTIISSLLKNAEHAMMQFPIPAIKQIYVSNSTATMNDMKTGSTLARVGHYGNCLFGSFSSKFNPVYPHQSQYLQNDTNVALFGGETCHPEDLSTNLCVEAEANLRRLHTTYLSRDHSQLVMENWEKNKCFHRISRYLGYNLHLDWVIMKTHVDYSTESQLCVAMQISNEGYSAVHRPYTTSLIFLKDGKTAYTQTLQSVDIREVLPRDSKQIHENVSFPHRTGSYQVMLAFIPEDRHRLKDSPDYNILLSNRQTFNNNAASNMGLNDLELNLTVTLNHHHHLHSSSVHHQNYIRYHVSSSTNNRQHEPVVGYIDCVSFTTATSRTTAKTNTTLPMQAMTSLKTSMTSRATITNRTTTKAKTSSMVASTSMFSPTSTPLGTTSAANLTTTNKATPTSYKSTSTSHHHSTTTSTVSQQTTGQLQKSTLTSTSTLTTTALSTITTRNRITTPSHTAVCDRVGVVTTIGFEVGLNNTGPCSFSSLGSERVVYRFCNSSDTFKWKPGSKVLDVCTTLPLFTPIASFYNGVFYGEAGVFLGCLNNVGFKIAIQLCGKDKKLELKHIDPLQASPFDVPEKFYVVTW